MKILGELHGQLLFGFLERIKLEMQLKLDVKLFKEFLEKMCVVV